MNPLTRMIAAAALLGGIGLVAAAPAGSSVVPPTPRVVAHHAAAHSARTPNTFSTRLVPHHAMPHVTYHAIIKVNSQFDPASGNSCAPGNHATCTLRQAITIANDSPGVTDEIVFAAHFTINLTQGTLDISRSVWINGPGVTINGQGSEAFYVGSNASVTMTGLWIRGGDASSGGGLYCDYSTVLLSGVTMSNNGATYGGAIYSDYCSVYIDSSRIEVNHAEYGGGAYFEYSSVTLLRDTIGGSLSSLGNYGYEGSGIFNDYTEMNVVSTTIDGNNYNDYGYGGGIYQDYGSLDVNSSSISFNTFTLYGGEGAGLYNYEATVRIVNTSMNANTISGDDDCYGAAIRSEYGEAVNLQNVTFVNNALRPTASHSAYGGTIYSYEDYAFNYTGGTISGQVNGVNGQDSYIEGGALDLQSYPVVVTGVSILNTQNNSLPSEDIDGGAIYSTEYASLTGLNIHNTVNHAYYIGGGVLDLEGETVVTGSSISATSSLASYSGGGTLVEGGVIYTDSEVTVNGLSITGSTVSANLAGLSTPSTTSAKIHGGIIYTDDGFQANGLSIVGGSVVASGGNSEVLGGAFYLDSTSAILDNTQTVGLLVKADDYVEGGLLDSYYPLTTLNFTLAGSVVKVVGGPDASSPVADGSLVYSGSASDFVNTTIASNTTSVANYGDYNWGVENGTDQLMRFTNSTLANDKILGPSGGYGSFLVAVNHASAAAFHNSIVSSASASHNCTTGGSSGIFLSSGFNIDSGNGCVFNQPGDMHNTNPLVLPIANNGGSVWTAALKVGTKASPSHSPAINAGSNIGCWPTDARGVARPQKGTCDIGAYEVS